MTPRDWIVSILVGVLAGLLEATFLTFLPSPWSSIHPILLLVVVFVIRERPRKAVAVAATASVLLDAFVVEGYPVALFRLVLVTALLHLFARRVLTNHSFYSAIALVFFARGIDHFFRISAHLLTRFHSPALAFLSAWSSIWREIAWDVVLIGAFFIIRTLISRRFVSVSTFAGRRMYG